MSDLLLNVGKLAVGLFCILGPVVLSIAFLRSRDRRENDLSLQVLTELNSPELRGLYSVRVSSHLLGADRVTVDLWGCSRDQVWDLTERLSARLPANIQVEVNDITSSRLSSKLILTFKNGSRMAYCNA